MCAFVWNSFTSTLELVSYFAMVRNTYNSINPDPQHWPVLCSDVAIPAFRLGETRKRISYLWQVRFLFALFRKAPAKIQHRPLLSYPCLGRTYGQLATPVEAISQGPNIYKDTKPLNVCLYWYFIEFIDWRYSQSCLYFLPLLWTCVPLTFSLVPPLPLFLCG